jgi:ABC-2 type transport system ATP-binding protein
MIRAVHLTRTFDDRTAVDDVSFEVHSGEIFGLLGPNGAGKTTTLRMLAGLIAPTSGSATVAGIPVRRDSIDLVRASVGFLTEAPGLWDRLSVHTNLLVYARLYGVPEPHRAVAEALAMFGMTDRAETPAAQLSKGMKQKVAIARALIHDPPVVLLDEPTAGLDPQTTRTVRELILELRSRGRSIIISTHNLDEAERLSDRIGVLQCRFLAVDSPTALRGRLFGRRVRIDLGQPAAPLAEVVERAGGNQVEAEGTSIWFSFSETAKPPTPRILRALMDSGAEIHAVEQDEAPLEDVYLKLVGETVERQP